MSTTEYQATLVCMQDPCLYCRTEARTFGLRHPDGPFDTWTGAHDYALGMCQKVYGTEHRIVIEEREVSDWQTSLRKPTVDTAALRAKAARMGGDDTNEYMVSGRDIRALCDAYDEVHGSGS